MGLFLPGALRSAPLPETGVGAVRSPEIRGISFAFFHDATGESLGRLRIERVTIEPGREGFLRVAWKPVTVLEGMTLEIGAAAKWPVTGAKILSALRGVAGEEGLLRNIRVRIAGPGPRELSAPSGRIRRDGAIELAPFGGPTICLWLIGPQAGQVQTAVPLAPPRRAISGSVPPATQLLN